MQTSNTNPQSESDLPFSPAPGETQKAFETFLSYFDMGQTRSFTKLAKLTGVNVKSIKSWATRFCWQERLRAYHTHLLRARLAMDTDARRNEAELRAERARLLEDAEWKVAEMLLRAAQNTLDLLIQSPGKRTLTDVARAVEIASKLGRLATGGANEQVAHAGEVNLKFQLEIEDAIRKVYGPIVDATPEEPADNQGECKMQNEKLEMN
jgi:hypothetical protein